MKKLTVGTVSIPFISGQFVINQAQDKFLKDTVSIPFISGQFVIQGKIY